MTIAVPANNDRTPRYMEKALAALHQANHHGHPITLAYAAHDGKVGLQLRFPDRLESLVTSTLLAHYPNCSISAVHDAPQLKHAAALSTELTLVPDLYPILRHAQFEDSLNGTFADPVSGILRAIKPDDAVQCRVEIHITPARGRRCRQARNAVRLLDREFFRHHHRIAEYYAEHIMSRRWILAWVLGLIASRSPHSARSIIDTSAGRLHDREELLQAASEKVGGHLFEVQIILTAIVPRGSDLVAHDRLQQMVGAFGAFTQSRLARFHRQPATREVTIRQKKPASLMSHEELATLFHPPTSTTLAERMTTTEFTELEPPADIPSGAEEESVTIGLVRFRNDHRQVGLARAERRSHVYTVGKTGMGKSTLLLNMIHGDLRTNQGVCLIDGHGDLAEATVQLVPRHRTNDVIFFDVADPCTAVRFNPLACREPARINQVTSGVVSAFKKLHDSWGPRLEDTLRNAVFVIVEHGGNMLSLMRLLGEKQYREQIIATVDDHVVRSFWQHDFAHWSDNYRTEAVAAIQNKIRPFLTNTHIREIVTQPGPSLDLRHIMDHGKILIVNLSKGRVGEDNATLLGAFLVTSMQQAAMTRADVPENDRRDFFLYVDEFQNFTSGSFASVLSEARKFHLSLTIAHQYLSQLNDETANAIWGNVGSIIAFQVGSDDAETIAHQLSKFSGQLQSHDLTSLPKYTAYARLLIHGMPTNPFSIETVPPPDPDTARGEVVRARSRRQVVHTAA